MDGSLTICLKFGTSVGHQVRARICYAFRVFAAIFDYRVVEPTSDKAAISCFYGNYADPERKHEDFPIPALYFPRPPNSDTPRLAKHLYGSEMFHLLYGTDSASGKPDWLGEIFEWISSSYEADLDERDSVGRIPYDGTIFGRQGISPRKPHATLLMAWLENSLRNRGTTALPKALCPVPGVEHLVVCSHDIDFYYTSRSSAFVRLLKNLGVSCRLYRSWSYFASNSRMILELIGGKRVGDYLPALLEAMQQCDIQSTLFVVTRHGHRRDPTYRLEELSKRLSEAAKKGFPVELHGSYSSIIENRTLSPEVAALQQASGIKPMGSRQHWLRFDSHDKLFDAIERVGLLFDSSLGFSEAAGFRNGASFAFPPYDFAKERPCNFLEIPLVLMDGNLEATSRSSGEDAQEIADEILGQSRQWSWGGMAALWHNPIEPLSVPKEINRVFWNCVKRRKLHAEKWVSAEGFLSSCLSRYQAAGLMKG